MSRKSKFAAMTEAIQSVKTEETSVFDSEDENAAESSADNIELIDLSLIYVNPDQFRKYFDPDEQEKLKNSIQENGFQGAILLRPLPNEIKTKIGGNYEFELIYGESRYRAVKNLGHDTIPSMVRELTDSQTRRIRLDENLVRKNLNPIEEVEGIVEIAADVLGVSTKKVVSLLDEVANAASRGKGLKGDVALQADQLQEVLDYYKKGTLTGFRTKRAKLQRLPDDIKKAVQERLNWTKAIEIAPVKDAGIRKKMLQWAIKENPSVAEIRKRRRELIKSVNQGKQNPANDNLMKMSFYKGLAEIRKSEEWSNPENEERIKHLIQEIEEIFHIKIS